jgi:hypothetical protein
MITSPPRLGGGRPGSTAVVGVGGTTVVGGDEVEVDGADVVASSVPKVVEGVVSEHAAASTIAPIASDTYRLRLIQPCELLHMESQYPTGRGQDSGQTQ